MDNIDLQILIASIITPIIGYILYMIKSKDNKIEHLSERMNILQTFVEKEVAVTDVEIKGIHDKLSDIKKAVDKIADKL